MTGLAQRPRLQIDHTHLGRHATESNGLRVNCSAPPHCPHWPQTLSWRRPGVSALLWPRTS